jgi:hypothetical protein
VVPVWYLLLWTTTPALLLAGIAFVLGVFIQYGYTSAVRWQIWLRFPNTSAVLAVTGLVLIHLYLYTTASPHASSYQAGLPDGVDQLGAIALGLAVLPLVFRRLEYQIIASPFVIGTIMWTHSYTNMAVVIAVLATAIIGWWLVRIRPAGAFSDPTHPATVVAAELETIN